MEEPDLELPDLKESLRIGGDSFAHGCLQALYIREHWRKVEKQIGAKNPPPFVTDSLHLPLIHQPAAALPEKEQIAVQRLYG